MNYRDLEIWKLASEAAIGVHRMTLRELPKFEMYEEASQIRRSVKSRTIVSLVSDPASRIPDPVSRVL